MKKTKVMDVVVNHPGAFVRLKGKHENDGSTSHNVVGLMSSNYEAGVINDEIGMFTDDDKAFVSPHNPDTGLHSRPFVDVEETDGGEFMARHYRHFDDFDGEALRLEAPVISSGEVVSNDATEEFDVEAYVPMHIMNSIPVSVPAFVKLNSGHFAKMIRFVQCRDMDSRREKSLIDKIKIERVKMTKNLEASRRQMIRKTTFARVVGFGAKAKAVELPTLAEEAKKMLNERSEKIAHA